MSKLDQDELEVTIELIEEDGPLDNLSELYCAIFDAFDGKFSTTVIRARILEWGIVTQTQSGRHRTSPIFESNHTGTRSIYTPSGSCPYRLA